MRLTGTSPQRSGRFAAIASLSLSALVVSPVARGAVAERGAEEKSGLTVGTERLRVVMPGWELTLGREDGRLLTLRDRAGAGVTLRGGRGLWKIERDGLDPVGPEGATFRHKWEPRSQTLVLIWERPEVQVTLTGRIEEEGIDWRPEIRMLEGTMLGWMFPDGLEFDAGAIGRFVFPDNLGVAFLPGFFRPFASGNARAAVGGRGMEHLLGAGCAMRPVDDARIALRPGRDAAGWLPDWYRGELGGWRVKVNRPFPAERSDLVLVEGEHGPWLTGHRLGGEGWLFRFGGFLDEGDFRPQMASVMATVSRLWPEAGRGPGGGGAPGKIGVLAFPAGVTPGNRLASSAERWVDGLRAHRDWMRARGGVQVAEIADLDSLLAALGDPGAWRAIVNPMGESFPARSAEGWAETLDAIRAYVRAGGVWWETGGGYSFHSVMAPSRDFLIRSGGRHFCDFAAVESGPVRWDLYGVQDRDAQYAPPALELASSGEDSARRGTYRHRHDAHAAPGGKVWRGPAFRMEMRVSGDLGASLARYRSSNGLGRRRLEEKVSGPLLERLRSAVLVKLDAPTFAEQIAVARRLPAPALVHVSNFLRGGFDKQYPDHLPPNPAVGTGEEFAELIAACREAGHPFMPYTNPTWWCIEPKGPTFEAEGEDPLSRDLAGRTIPESYGSAPNRGYTICAWHPAVRRANDVIVDQFTRLYPVDLLFQDQVGARGHRWDTNPAAPDPGAYLEGIHRIAREDARRVPLATEDGHERLIDNEAMFCGLSAPWLRNRGSGRRVLYWDAWPEGAWRLEPLALYLAHGSTLFYHHDLGGFVRDRRDLALSVAMGYGLSLRLRSGAQLGGPEGRWLECLHRVQRALGARLAGASLDSFGYINERAPRSVWGCGVEVVANLDATAPLELEGGVKVAPEGFFARTRPAPGPGVEGAGAGSSSGEELEAGIVTALGGRDFGAEGKLVIRRRSGQDWEEWVAEVPLLE